MIRPGDAWTRSVCVPTGGVDRKDASPSAFAQNSGLVTPSVDVLKFADGSNWGPKDLPQSSRLLGTFDGVDFIADADGLETKNAKNLRDIQYYISPIPPERAPLGVQDLRTQSIGPLTFTSGIWRDEKGVDFLAVDATNNTDRAIRGYVFTEIFVDPSTGSRLRRVATKQLAIRENPSEYLVPGATWTAGRRKFSHLPDGTLAAYKIVLDFVVYADGGTYGPKRSSESDELLGMIDGIRIASAQDVASSTQ